MQIGDQVRKYQGLVTSAAQQIAEVTGINERAHDQLSATVRGEEQDICAAYNKHYGDGNYKQHTYYCEDGGYGNYNSNNYYTDVELHYYGYDSCGYNVQDANFGHYTYYHGEDGYGDYNSEGEYACANIGNYNDGSCGYTSYEEDYGYYNNTYGGGNHCKTKYGGYHNDYIRAKTGR